MKQYTGVGSRETPKAVLEAMTRISRRLDDAGYTLRSGAAAGADSAFEAGSTSSVIYLPWARFRDHPSPYHHVTERAMALAAQYHPAWHLLNKHARLLHGRNAYQVLGLDLKSKTDFVVCWTRGAKPRGGTATAIRIAQAHAIPVYNLAAWSEAQVLKRVLDGK